jgi:hypothetical protein
MAISLSFLRRAAIYAAIFLLVFLPLSPALICIWAVSLGCRGIQRAGRLGQRALSLWRGSARGGGRETIAGGAQCIHEILIASNDNDATAQHGRIVARQHLANSSSDALLDYLAFVCGKPSAYEQRCAQHVTFAFPAKKTNAFTGEQARARTRTGHAKLVQLPGGCRVTQGFTKSVR